MDTKTSSGDISEILKVTARNAGALKIIGGALAILIPLMITGIFSIYKDVTSLNVNHNNMESRLSIVVKERNEILDNLVSTVNTKAESKLDLLKSQLQLSSQKSTLETDHKISNILLSIRKIHGSLDKLEVLVSEYKQERNRFKSHLKYHKTTTKE